MDNGNIDSLQIEITSSTTNVESSLKNLEKSLKKLKTLSDIVANINTSGINNLNKIAKSIEKIALAGASGGLGKTIENLKKLSNMDLSKFGVDTSGVSQPLEEITKDKPQISMLDISKGYDTNGSFFQTLQESIVNSVDGYKNGASEILSSLKMNLSYVGGLIGKGFNNIRGIFSKNIANFEKRINSLFKAVVRVARYRVIRFVLNQITTAFKEGTNNVYQYSKAIGGNLANSMDKLATSSLYFKNSIGAMVSPLINTIAPVIDMLVDKVVSLINVFNQLFSMISGASGWTKAIKYPTEYSKAVGGAAKANKDFSMGFDELNVISDSASGGGAGGMDFKSMFEEVSFDDSDNLMSKIRKWVEQGNWSSIGALLGEKINEITNLIKSSDIGEKIGQVIQKCVQFAYSFLLNTDFIDVGIALGTQLTSLIEQIDWVTLGDTLAKKFLMFKEVIVGFIASTDWGEVIISLIELGAGFVRGLLDGVLNCAVALFPEIFVGLHNILEKIKETVTTTWNNLKITIATKWEEIKANTSAIWQNIKDTLSTTWGNIKSTAINGFNNLKQGVIDIWNGIWSGIKNTINSIISGVEKMVNSVISGLNTMINALNSLKFDVPDWVPFIGGKVFSLNIPTVKSISIPRLADGGFPDVGQLFIAREAGAEMVGSIGRRTAVANNDQIVEGIYEGVLAAMQQSNSNSNFDVNVYLDGKQITASVEKHQRERGATIYSGGVLYGI